MRLTFVVNWIKAEGGAERVLSNMANYWAEKGWEITIVNLQNEKGAPFYWYDPRITHRPINFYLDSSNPVQRLANVFKRHLILRRAIQDSKPDCIISFDRPQNIRTIISMFGLHIPTLITEHTTPGYYQLGKRLDLLHSWLYPFASSLIVLTSSSLSYFSKRINKSAHVIPNTVATPEDNKSGGSQDGLTGKGKVLVAMGRLKKEKGFDLLLNAFGDVAPKYPDWNLVIWGEGDLRPSLEKQRDQLGLQGRVRFPGVTRQPNREMQKADLFVMSSRWEGFPNVLCEAMACGLPVVSFDCPHGPGAIIRNDIDGILVAPEDVPALTGVMDRLMGDELERSRLAKRAPEITQRFSKEKVMAMWEKLIQKVTGINLIDQNQYLELEKK